MTKRLWARFFCLIGWVTLCFGSASSAWACAICAPAGESTLVSRLAAARQVLLARPMAQPGEFTAVVAVKGALPEPTTQSLQGVVDDRAVRRGPGQPRGPTPTAPDTLALLTYSALTQRWMHIGDLPRERLAWLRQLAAMPPASQLIGAGWPARLQFFGPDLENPVPLVAQAAYEEVASAPYALMRQAFRAPGPGIKPSPLQAAAPRTTQLLGWLQDGELTPRHSLYYLLLGLAADPRSVDYLMQSLAPVAGTNSGDRPGVPANRADKALSPADMSAILAALIEIRGAAVLPWVEKHFLTHAAPMVATMSPEAQRQSMVQAQAAVLALGVHGTLACTRAESGSILTAALTTEQVVQVYARYIRSHPAMAGLVSSDLANWAQWQFAEPFAQALQSQAFIPFASRYAMVFYLLRNPRPEAKAWVEKLRRAQLM